MTPFRVSLAKATIPLVFVALVLASVRAAAGEFVTLYPGIVVDGPIHRIYAPDRQGRMHAIDADTGQIAWRQDRAAFPLGLLDGRLLAQIETLGEGRTVLALLDTADGTILGETEVTLPDAVAPQTRAQPNRRFDIVAVPHGDGLRLRWHYRRWPLRGAPNLPDASEMPVPDQREVDLSGVIDVRNADGRLAVAQGEIDIEEAIFVARLLTHEARFPGADGEHALAADARAVLVSDPVDHPTLGPAFRWDLRTADGTRVGTLENVYPMAPFVLRGSVLIHRLDPMMIDTPETGRVEHGSRLIAHDLASGRMRWSFDVVERRWLGPLPP